jgi:hypothetical protein
LAGVIRRDGGDHQLLLYFVFKIQYTEMRRAVKAFLLSGGRDGIVLVLRENHVLQTQTQGPVFKGLDRPALFSTAILK